MNKTLTKLEGKQTQPENFQALNLIGKTVAGDSSKVVRTQFDNEHDFNYNLPQDATEATVKLLGAKGEAIREYKLTNLKSGANKLSWNGMNEAGVKQPAGEYSFHIEAKNSQGGKIPVNTQFKGEITGLSFSAEGPVLQVGSQTIKMRDISQITDSSARVENQRNDQISKNSTSLDLKNTGETKQNSIKEDANVSSNTAAQRRGLGVGSVMTDVAMSHEVMNSLQKEMK